MTPTTEQLEGLVAWLRSTARLMQAKVADEAADTLQAWIAEREKAGPFGYVFCYQGQDICFSKEPQDAGIPVSYYWQEAVYLAPPDFESLRKQLELYESIAAGDRSIRNNLETQIESLRANAERWISVEDALPNNQQTVLISYTTHWGKRAVTIGWHTKAKCLESGNFESEVDDEYDEESDTYYMKEQWVDESIESEYHYSISNVTHWMPLPNTPSIDEARKGGV